ncbi:MAG: GH2, partial [uncultured Solirubrobacteraceae bacterium]
VPVRAPARHRIPARPRRPAGARHRRRGHAAAAGRARPGLAVRPRSRRAVQAGPRPARLRRQGRGEPLRRQDRLVRAEVPGPAHERGLGLGHPLRGRAPSRRGLPQRPEHRPQRRSVHAVQRPGQGDDPGSGEHAPRPRRQPPHEGPARGLVELGRHQPPGPPRAARARRPAGHRRARARRLLGRVPRIGARRRLDHQPRRQARPALRRGAPEGAGGRPRHAADGPAADDPPRRARAPAGPRPGPGPARAVGAGAPRVVRGDDPGTPRRRRPGHAVAAGRPALGARARRAPLLQRPSARAARRVDPGGHARPRPGADRRRHRPHRLGPQGAQRERHPRALPARRPAARPARRGGHPRLEPGAGLPPRRPAAHEGGPGARARRRPPHGHGGAPAPVGAHALGRQRAVADARREPDDARVPAARQGDHRAARSDGPDLRGHPGVARVPAPEHVRDVLAPRAQQLLRLVRRRQEPRDGEPQRPRAVPRPRAQAVLRPGARDDRVRRRGHDGRPGERQGELRVPAALPAVLPRHHRGARLPVGRHLLDAAGVRREARLGRRREAHGHHRRRARPDPQQGPAPLRRRRAQARVRARPVELRQDADVPHTDSARGRRRARRGAAQGVRVAHRVRRRRARPGDPPVGHRPAAARDAQRLATRRPPRPAGPGRRARAGPTSPARRRL